MSYPKALVRLSLLLEFCQPHCKICALFLRILDRSPYERIHMRVPLYLKIRDLLCLS
jgi:hypothetical protein